MAEGRHPYRQFRDQGFSLDGIPLDSPPPYNPQRDTITIIDYKGVSTVPQQPPSSCMVLSVISFFFCIPLSLVAIYFSGEASHAAGTGHYELAKSKRRTAVIFALLAITIGIVGTVIIVLFQMGAFQKAQEEAI